MANSVDLDEVAHDEPPHQDLHCLQLFSSLVVKELNTTETTCFFCQQSICLYCLSGQRQTFCNRSNYSNFLHKIL